MAFYNEQGVVAPLDRFGADDHSWNVGESCHGDDSGRPGVMIFAQALQVWSSLQADTLNITVRQTADAFFVTPALIVQAVDAHPWMCWERTAGDVETWVIGHDGE